MFKSVAPTDIANNRAAHNQEQPSPVLGKGNNTEVNGYRQNSPIVAGSNMNDVNSQQRVLMKEQRLEDIKNQCSELISELDSDDDPEAIVKKHISQLKKYNELKDIALGLVTMIADQRKLRTTDILEEMKVELADD
ncbi:Piso0_005063 [Millerozyma farinosa CBS 7064]|uniref:Piso0_005063 protein n=1 Tax=Pichia sorbitophila (strain ATCC MYA-4447 / BCRC 22081 / CBS 7064 / NBRC 10061 / NRRL Y-12695) TaxID=559304 RepID=G8Y449_PICSO|nr:Piso0_005063 [Millerozyma farinosa CBS 7064]